MTTSRSRQHAGRLLKSPLAVAGDYGRRDPAEDPCASRVIRAAVTERRATLTEFEDYLRTVNTCDGRPFEETTINAYVSPGKNFDAWLTAEGIDGGT